MYLGSLVKGNQTYGSLLIRNKQKYPILQEIFFFKKKAFKKNYNPNLRVVTNCIMKGIKTCSRFLIMVCYNDFVQYSFTISNL